MRAGLPLLACEDTTHGTAFDKSQLHVLLVPDAAKKGFRLGYTLLPHKGSDTDLYATMHAVYQRIFASVALHFALPGAPPARVEFAAHMADAADEATKGFLRVHPDAVPVMCGPHLTRAVAKHTGKFTSLAHEKRFMPFVGFLVKCPHPKVVPWAKALFVAELRAAGQRAFLDYWLREWNGRNFQHGTVPHGTPLTNNNVEVTNRVAKLDMGSQMTDHTTTLVKICDVATFDSKTQGEFATAPNMATTDAKAVWKAAQD